MKKEKILNCFEYAFRKVHEEQGKDFLFCAQERARAGRLFTYIRDFLIDYEKEGIYLDLEYNRAENTTKKFCLACGDDRINKCDICKHWVAPDIIFHRRGEDKQNNFVCEIKNKDKAVGHDSEKIKSAIKEHNYSWGVYIYEFTTTDMKMSLFNKKLEIEDYYFDFEELKLLRNERI